MKRLGVGIVVLLTILGMFWLGYQFYQEEQKTKLETENNEKMQKELNALNVRERELEEELNALETDKKERIQAKGSTILLFTGMDKQIYKNAYPIMQEYRYKGVLLIAEDAYPGAEGCMTMSQFEELIGNGWSYCVLWNGDKDVAKWHERQEDLFRELELEQSDAVYFPKGTYKSGYAEALKDLGYKTIAHCGDEDLEIIQTEVTGSVWYPGTYGMNAEQPRYKLETAMEKGGAIVFRIGFSAEEEKYEETTFDAMLNWMDSYQEDKKLQVLDFSEAQAFHKNLTKKRQETEEGTSEEVARLNQELADVQKQIDDIYKKYFDGSAEVGKSVE